MNLSRRPTSPLETRARDAIALRADRSIAAGRKQASAARRGFTMLEFLVAVLLFGIAISGMFPLVVMYSRVLESLEQRPTALATHRAASTDNVEYRATHPLEWRRVGTSPYTKTVSEPNAGEWVHKWYVVPFTDPYWTPNATSTTPTWTTWQTGTDAWARKLGASASIRFKNTNSDTNTSTKDPEYSEALDETTAPTTEELLGIDAQVPSTSSYQESPISTDPEHPWTSPMPDDAAAYNGSRRQSPVGATTTPCAIWTFTVTKSGLYQIEATGLVPGTLPSGCNYAVSTDSGSTWGSAITPGYAFAPSSVWQPIAIKRIDVDEATHQCVVQVKLTADTAGSAFADGMRLRPVSLQIEKMETQADADRPFDADTAEVTVKIKPTTLEKETE